MKKVFIVVVHYKGRELTQKCLSSLRKLKLDKIGVKIVVVDNHSTEPLEEIAKEFPGVVYLKNSVNLGFADGNNVGIKYALRKEADYILLLNNDTTVDGNLVMKLFKAAEKDSKIGILAPKIYFAPGYEYHKSRYKADDRGKVIWFAGGIIDWQNVFASHRGVDEVDAGQYDQQQQTDFVSGCAMLVKKEVFDKVGLLDSRYFLYLEDLDFCLRAKSGGFKIVYCPEGKVWHYNAGSSQVGGPLHDYFFTRNRLLFGIKNAPVRTKAALLKEAGRLFINGRLWQKKGVMDFVLGRLGKGSWVES